MVLGAQHLVVLGVGGPRHAPIQQHRLKVFGLEHPNFDIERGTRAVVDFIAALSKAVGGEVNTALDFVQKLSVLGISTSDEDNIVGLSILLAAALICSNCMRLGYLCVHRLHYSR